MFLRAILLSAGALCAPFPAQAQQPGNGPASRARAFARELWVREAAADLDAASAWLSQALDCRPGELPWTRTADALEALSRALDARPEVDIGPWRASVLRWTDHWHPNLRAGAWRVLALASSAAPSPASAASRVTTWEERMERARLIARRAIESAEFEALCNDSDARVAQVGLAEGIQAAARDDELIAQAWMRAFEAARSRADESAIELLQLLELAPRGERLARRVAELAALRVSGLSDDWSMLHALCLACLGRQAGALDAAQLDLLCAQWVSAARWHRGARALLSRAARAIGAPLGERLAAEACSHPGNVDAALECFAGAVEALDTGRLLSLVERSVLAHPVLAEPLFDSLRGRVEAWDPEALAAWLAAAVAPSQRAHTLLIVAETFRQNRDPGSAEILVRALEDPDPAAAAEAFQGLAGAPDPRPWMEAVHTAWARRPVAWREERLADLSREIAWTPFRADLLELASQSRTTSARAAELLAPFRGDVEVAEALREWLEQDLARLRERAPRVGEAELDPRIVSSALSLLRALVLVADEAAIPGLVAALEASRGRSLELGKAAILHLGRSAEGRRGLKAWLAPPAASRLRAEAALALAPHPGREAAIELLLLDYSHYDEDLRVRALRAFALADDAGSANRLLEAARARDVGAAEMLAAVECLGTRARRAPGLVEDLFRWLDETGLDPDLRILTIAELVRLKTPDVQARLAARFTRLEVREPRQEAASRASQEQAFEREILITAMAAADAGGQFSDRVPFELPLERAADDFSARAAGEYRADVEFTCRAELELIAAFARAGRLEGALASVSGWRGLDARFLLESAARVHDEAARAQGGQPSVSERLSLAAQIALGGELGVDDTPRIRFDARHRVLEAARARGDELAFAARGAVLEREVRSGALPAWIFARAYGEFDPRHGIDGLAKLACDVHLARARAALAEDRVEEARAEIEEARSSCGVSNAARAAVGELAKVLEKH